MMTHRVIAFVEDTPAAAPVIAMASLIGVVLDSTVEAVHVGRDGGTATALAERAGIPLRLVPGQPIEEIVTELRSPDVLAGVLGARNRPTGPTPAGHIPLSVVTRVDKLVAVVPPGALVSEPGSLQRILVPLDGSDTAARAMERVCECFARTGTEIEVVHVFDETTTPKFWDQPQHAAEAWGEAFLARFVAMPEARIRLLAGVPQQKIMALAREEGVGAIAMGWSQRLEPGRAGVVLRALSDSPVPVLLVPVGST